MQPLRTRKNQYRGINAHLHSLLQSESGWGGFHTIQIADLYKSLINALEPLGYTAEVEESLQVRRVDGSSRNPRSDILLYDTDPTRLRAKTQAPDAAIQRVPALQLLAEDDLSEKPYRAIAIYELDEDQVQRGEPVAWIELLSPSNKRGHDGESYHTKRMDVLRAGLVFVEIDYLHESRPTFAALPPYRTRNGGALLFEPHPYRIVVIEPRPTLERGWAEVVGIDVDEPLPVVDIPLNGDDKVAFDFGEPYRKSVDEGLFGNKVDYAALPLNFDRYSPADQARIARRMVAVLTASEDERQHPPLAVDKSLELDEALVRLALSI